MPVCTFPSQLPAPDCTPRKGQPPATCASCIHCPVPWVPNWIPCLAEEDPWPTGRVACISVPLQTPLLGTGALALHAAKHPPRAPGRHQAASLRVSLEVLQVVACLWPSREAAGRGCHLVEDKYLIPSSLPGCPQRIWSRKLQGVRRVASQSLPSPPSNLGTWPRPWPPGGVPTARKGRTSPGGPSRPTRKQDRKNSLNPKEGGHLDADLRTLRPPAQAEICLPVQGPGQGLCEGRGCCLCQKQALKCQRLVAWCQGRASAWSHSERSPPGSHCAEVLVCLRPGTNFSLVS